MAVIEEVAYSQDGLVRKVKINKDTSLKNKIKDSSSYWKPITGLIPLEFQEEE